MVAMSVQNWFSPPDCTSKTRDHRSRKDIAYYCLSGQPFRTCVRRYLLPITLLFLLATNQSVAAEATDEPTEDDLVIVELLLGQISLSDSLFAYNLGNELFLPLEELAYLLDFHLTVDADNGSAKGWFIEPERTFDLNLARGTVTLAGIQQQLPESHRILRRNGDLYVPHQQLETWFPIQLKLNFADMRLMLLSREPLPLEKKLQREKQRTMTTSGTVDATVLRYRADSYHWTSYPLLDATLSSTLDVQKNQNTMAAALSARGDLLKHAAYLSYNYDNQLKDTHIRFNLSRYAPTPDQRLFDHLFSYRLGDLYTQGDPLISNGGDGTGIAFTSSATEQRGQHSSTVIEGDAPAGWEAELYYNGSLLSFQTTSNDGIYRFENIDLNYGNNNFEVRLYGPQGQTRIERRSSYIGTNQLPPGGMNYSFYALDEKNNRLFGNPFQVSNSQSQRDIHAEWNVGLTNHWSTGLSWNQLLRGENNELKSRNYLSWSNDISLENAFLQTLYSEDIEGGRAALLSFRTRLGQQNIELKHRYFSDFSSEQNRLDNPLKSDTELRLNGNFKLGKSISYSLTASQQAYEASTDRFTLESRLSSQIAGTNVTNNLAASKSSGNSDISLPGSLNVSRYSREGGVSATLSYNLSNNNFINSVSTNIRHNLDQKRHNLVQLTYAPDSENSWSINNNFTWKLDQANLSLRAQVDQNESWLLAASMNFSAGYDSYTASPWISSRPMGHSGSLNARIFWDRDNNGTFSEGDEPLYGVSMLGHGPDRDTRSDEDGHLLLRALPSFRAIGLSINEDTLEDPYWQLRKEPDALYLHSGAQTEMEFPIVAVTEVEGHLFGASSDGRYPIKATRLLLVDSSGKVIATTKTEFDGLFLFEGVKPGTYQLLADGEYLQRKGLPAPPAKEIEVSIDGGILNTGSTVLYKRAVSQRMQTPPVSATTPYPHSIDPAADWQSVKPRYISPSQFKKLPGDLYAVQLLADADPLKIQQFTRQYNLTNTQFIQTRQNNQSRFALLSGLYANSQRAQQALDALPAAIHQHQPQILSVQALQQTQGNIRQLTDQYPARFPQRYQILASDFGERIQRTQKWLEGKPDTGYSLQLLASARPSELEFFIEDHHLQGQGLIIQSTRNGSPWYQLLYGYQPDRQGIDMLRNSLPDRLLALEPETVPLTALQPVTLADHSE